MSPVRGLVAGAAGTALMDLTWYARYRRLGGRVGLAGWEFSPHAETWDEAPAPARVARVLAGRLTRRDIPLRHAQLTNNLVHWAYGVILGGMYGMVRGDRDRTLGRRVASGALWGATVWSSGYMVLPLLGVYEPVWRYRPAALARDLTGHLVFGIGTACAFSILRGWTQTSLRKVFAAVVFVLVP